MVHACDTSQTSFSISESISAFPLHRKHGRPHARIKLRMLMMYMHARLYKHILKNFAISVCLQPAQSRFDGWSENETASPVAWQARQRVNSFESSELTVYNSYMQPMCTECEVKDSALVFEFSLSFRRLFCAVLWDPSLFLATLTALISLYFDGNCLLAVK